MVLHPPSPAVDFEIDRVIASSSIVEEAIMLIRWRVVIRNSMKSFFLYLLLLYPTSFCAGSDTLSLAQFLGPTDTLSSGGGSFQLGFFQPGNSSNLYLGIWIKKFTDRGIVWVANRESPLKTEASFKLQLSRDDLALFSRGRKVWSAAIGSLMSNSTEAVLLDTGNFVLRDATTIYWQSFDHPTDTILPGAKLGINTQNGQVQQLISWKNEDDPSPGMFSFRIETNGSGGLFLVWNNSYRYWSSGTSWDGDTLMSTNFLGYRNYSYFVRYGNRSYLRYIGSSILVMGASGRFMEWFSSTWSLDLISTVPINQSDVYAFCGAFGFFRNDESTLCECVQGFTPFTSNDWSSGCVRKTPLLCQSKNSSGNKDGFLKMSILSLPENSRAYQAASVGRCELECMAICSCTAYAYNDSGCLVWEGDLLNLHQPEAGGAGADIYIRLAASEFKAGTNKTTEFQAITTKTSGSKKMTWVILGVVIPLSLISLCLFTGFLCKGILIRKAEDDAGEDLLLFDFDSNQSSTTNASNSTMTRGKTTELPLFSYRSVATATGNFLEANKLGEGGFGPVYKGKLPKGQEIAVKRLSKRSGQGIEEFRNETILIAKLQHKNLVQLLGCCIQQDENILIYEYMPNKSLDFFLFDPTKREMLDCGTRISIIDGIAQGLLYLHQYSRVRIIHRDLKPSNILLDSEMNPKISDFGMARMFGGNETRANTGRIVGTYGYMSPEYAMEGQFSVKSDVFSFGVLLLEILSGRKNTSFHQTDKFTLLGYAWELWSSDRGLDLMDPFLTDAPSTSMLLRYLNMGLLCVQESAMDRPTMSDVVLMIANEHAPLPLPKQPAFIQQRSMVNSSSSERNAGIASTNNVTLSTIEGR